MDVLSRQKGQKILILVGLIFFVVGVYLTGGLFPFNIKEVDADTLHRWWLKALVRDAGAVLAVATIIIGATGSVRANAGRHWRKIMLCSGYGICLVFLVLNSIAYFQTDKILRSYDFSDVIAKIEKLLAQNRIPENRRPVFLRKLAETRFLQSGELIEIIGTNNRKQIYRPSKETLRFKQQNDRSRNLMGWIKKRAWNSIVLWTGVLFFSTLFGWAVPLKGKSAGQVPL